MSNGLKNHHNISMILSLILLVSSAIFIFIFISPSKFSFESMSILSHSISASWSSHSKHLHLPFLDILKFNSRINSMATQMVNTRWFFDLGFADNTFGQQKFAGDFFEDLHFSDWDGIV